MAMSLDYDNDFQERREKTEGAEQGGCGCWAWGCLIVTIGFLLVVGVTIGGLFWARNWMIQTALEVTEPEKAEMPEVALDDEQRQAIIDRWETFGEEVEQGKASSIELTADELNVLIDEELEEAGDSFHLSMEGKKISAQFAIPVEQLGQNLLRTDKLDGQFFNGEGTISVSYGIKGIQLDLESASFKGEPVPDQVFQELRQMVQDLDLTEVDNRDPELRKLLGRIERIEVIDGKLVLTIQEGGESSVEDAEETEVPEDREPTVEDETTEVQAIETDSTESTEEESVEEASTEETTTESETKEEEVPTVEEPSNQEGILQPAL